MDHVTFTAVQLYLFGNVKFLDLLVVLMLADIVTGVLKAIKEKRLRSRKALFGYARKLGVFVAVILANIIDQVLGLSGAITVATVLFYIANEGLSIIENLAQIGVKIPSVITDKLHVLQDETKEDTLIKADKMVVEKMTINEEEDKKGE